MMYGEPKLLHSILAGLAENIGNYANFQIDSGAQVSGQKKILHTISTITILTEFKKNWFPETDIFRVKTRKRLSTTFCLSGGGVFCLDHESPWGGCLRVSPGGLITPPPTLHPPRARGEHRQLRQLPYRLWRPGFRHTNQPNYYTNDFTITSRTSLRGHCGPVSW